MSKQVDERVVSMQFDNKNFETNVATTMSTLDKLKEKLNFTGASKGLENIDSAVNKVNMSGLSTAVETVRERFSVLEIVGVTALANLTNSAVNAGKKLVSSLTVDQVSSGWDKYSQKTSSVQTIMNATGKSIDEVNSYLEKLMWFSDETSYGFTDMTSALATMTSSGGDIEKLIPMIQGVANATAFAGKGASEFSRIMQYSINQAYSLGYMQVQDWKTIEGATVNSKQLIQTLIKAGEELGKIQKGTVTIENFRSSLADKWVDKEVMETAFGEFAEFSEAVYAAVESGQYDTASEAMEALSGQYSEIGETAFESAQQAKTFTEAIDATKDAVSSGWMKTFELLFGNYEEAKVLWTDLAQWLYEIFAVPGEIRNAILESALGKSFVKIGEQISTIMGPINNTVDTVEGAIDTIKDYGEVVNEIIRGDWGNGQTRWDALTDAGYDWAHAQNLVNEKLGVSLRRATDYTEAQETAANSTSKLTEADSELISELCELSDAELESLGYTEEQIEVFRELAKAAKKVGLPISEFIEKIDEIDGKWLFTESFANIGRSITGILTAIKEAWYDVFDTDQATMIENIASKIFDLLAVIHKFTRALLLTDEETGELNANGEKLKRTFKGIFAIVDMVCTVVGGPLKIAFKLFTQLLGAFDLNILDVTAAIGDSIVKCRDWLDSVFDLSGVFKAIVPYITSAVDTIKEWANALKESDAIKDFMSRLKEFANSIREWFNSLKDSENLPRDIIAGLVNGLKSGASTVWNAAIAIGKAVLESICNFLGIHSPSTKFIEVGKNIIDGLVQGLQNGISKAWKIITDIGSKILEFFKSLDFGTIFAGGLAVALTVSAVKIADTVSNIASPLSSLSGMFSSIGKGVEQYFKAKSWEKRSEVVLNFAKAIALLAASVYVLAQLDSGQLWGAIGALGALAGIIALLAGVLVGLDILMAKFGSGNALEMGSFAIALLSLSGSLLILTFAMKNIAGMSGGDIGKAAATLIGLSIIITALAFITDFTGYNLDKVGNMLLKLSVSLLLLVVVIKAISWLKPEELTVGLITIGILMVFFAGLMAATKLFNSEASSIGSTLLAMAASMLLMVLVIKLIAKLEPEVIVKGLVVMTLFSGIIVGLIAALSMLDRVGSLEKVSSTLLAMAASMLIMAIVVKILGGIETKALVKGTIAITALAGIMVLLVAATNLVGEKDLAKVGSTLLTMSLAIGILAVVAVVLGFVDVGHLAKGIIAVSMLAVIMALMITATKNATNCMGNIIAMTVAIAVMAAAVAVLSLIDTAKLASSTAALAVLMLSFAAMAKASESAGSWKSMASLIIMTAIVGVLAYIIYKLSELNAGSALSATASISLLLVSMALAMNIASKSASSWSKALIGIGLLTLMVIPLAAFCLALHYLPDVTGAVGNVILLTTLMTAMTLLLGVLTVIGFGGWAGLIGVGLLTAMVIPLAAFCLALHYLPDVTGAVGNVILLTTLMTAMTLLLAPLTLIGFLAIGALAGIIALTAMVIPLAAFALALAILPDITSAAGNVMLLTSLMYHMTNMLTILAPIAPLALLGVTAMAGLTALMVAIGAMAVVVGGLMETFPSLQSFLDTGIPVLIQLSSAIGTMIGEFVSSMLTSVSGSLPQIGTDLSAFMINAMPFITGIKMVDASMIENVKSLAGAIIALTAADLISNVSSFLTNGSSFADLGLELSNFMINAMPFVMGAKMLTSDMTTGVKALAETIIILTAADVVDSLTSWFTGGSSLADFGKEIAAFGPYMAAYAAAVKGIDGEAVTASANAAKALTEMAKTLPKEGGLVSMITGENDLATFGAQLVPFGASLLAYSVAVKDLDEGAISVSADAAKELIDMASEIPNSGGLVAKVTGENDLDTFGAKLVVFGASLLAYSTAVEGIDEDNIKASVRASKSLINMTKLIPESGGLIAKITGDNDLATFGSKLASYGTSLAAYSTSVENMTSDGVTASVTATRELITLVKDMGDLDISGAEEFKDAIKTLSETKLSEFVEVFSGASGEFSSIGADIITSISDGMTSSKTSLVNVAKALVNSTIEAFNSKVESFGRSGKILLVSLANGIRKNEKIVNNALTTIIKNANTAATSTYGSFYNTGSYLVTGFCSGISDSTWKAEAKAKAMANAAIKAAKEALDINSPSKVFRKIGYSVPEGFAMGIDRMSSMVADSSASMSDVAVNTVNDSIARIVDVINSDIDTEPTIRPVLDLSDVRSGVGSIGTLLSGKTTLSVGVQSAGEVATSMSNRQNGTNNDVVSAIKDLKKTIGNTGNSYSINGITYSEGDDAADLLKSLVRAIKIDGRA